MGGDEEPKPAEAVDTVADLQERLDVVTAFTGGIIFEFDREGTYLRLWTGEPQLLARPPQEILGRTIRETIGDPGGRFHDAIRSVFDTGEPVAFDYALDVQAGRRTFSCVMRPHEAPGQPRTVTMLVRDVTSAKALEAKLVQAERLGALGLLAASVGHEIRQPLAYVITSLDVLERDLDGARTTLSPEQTRASLEKIRSGAQRIAEIAASLDLLAQQRERTTSTVDVRRPIQAAIDLCSSVLSHVRVERRLAVVPLVQGDEGELCQVFANVLLNAAQALRAERTPPGTITVSAEPAGSSVRVSFVDTGAGIAPEHLARVFDPFFTTKEEEGGSGLGLFITRGIVDAHGGRLEITSEPGRGTTVVVLLPVAPASELPREPVTGLRPRAMQATQPVQPTQPTHAKALAPRLAPTSKAAAATRRRLSVLLVDDEPRFLDSLRLALEDTHAIETQLKARDAIAMVEKDPHRYDVVLCDLSMPELDGVTFYERMKALGVSDRFVIMTGGAFTSRAAKFITSKVCRSISKPFQLERLLALLDEVTAPPDAS